jgi:hypothetical protein
MVGIKDYGPEPVRKDLGTILVLLAVCPFGFLMWVGLFFTFQWSVLAAWDVAVGVLHKPTIAATAPSVLPSSAAVARGAAFVSDVPAPLAELRRGS